MSPRNLLKAILIIVAFSFVCGSQVAWAVWAPEPQSGGKYFRDKGTMSSSDYYYLGRTGTRNSADYYYGQGLRAGILNIRPRTSYAREFDSNIFLAPSDKKTDWVNRLDSGIDVQAPLQDGKYVLYGGVQSQSEWLVHNTGSNHTDWFYQGGAQANFNHFSASIFEDFRKTSDRSGTDFTGFNRREENYLTSLIDVPMSQVFFENEMSHYYLRFRNSSQELNDRWELREIPRFGMDIGGRTQALVEYAITPIRYFSQTSRDGLANAPSLGIRGFLGKGDLWSYQAWGGYENRSYDSSSKKDYNNFIARGDIRFRPSPLSELIAEASRRPEEAVNATDSWVTRNDLGVRYRRKVTDYGAVNVGGSVGQYDFSGGRDDFFWEALTKGEILLPGKFSSIFAEYRFMQKHSNQSGSDYIDHRINFGVKLEM